MPNTHETKKIFFYLDDWNRLCNMFRDDARGSPRASITKFVKKNGVLSDGTNPSMAHALEAVNKIFLDPSARDGSGYLRPIIDVESLTLQTPQGSIVLNLEGLQLKGLMHLGGDSLDLEVCRALLTLSDIIVAWQPKPLPDPSGTYAEI